MATGSPNDRPSAAHALFRNHQGIEAPAADMPCESTALTKRVANTAEQFGPIVNEPSGSLKPTSLLVADQGDYGVSGRCPLLRHESQGRHDHHRNPTFHVDSPTTP